MKTSIRVYPVEFSGSTVTFKIPSPVLLEEVVEIKNQTELEAVLAEVKTRVKADAQIFVKALSRKFGGFDKFYNENRALFYINKDPSPL